MPILTKKQLLLQRFESKFIRAGPDECWIWNALFFQSSGYGQFKVNGTPTNAHRVSYELYIGIIPEGLWVLHECDVRACVNPNHLFLGTALDNNHDMINKGRAKPPKGEDHGMATLTDNQVQWIRDNYKPKHPVFGQCAMARKLGVRQQSISKIVLGLRRKG